MFHPVPFSPIRSDFYTPQELMGTLDPGDYRSFQHTLDFKCFAYYKQHGSAAPNDALTSIFEALHTVAAIHVSAILPFLDRSLQLAARRNEFVHAVALMDFVNNELLLKTRKGVVPPDEKLMIDLGSEAALTARKIAEECEELLRYYLDPTEDQQDLAPEW